MVLMQWMRENPPSRGRPGLLRMLARGFRKHCPRCGAGHLFRSWFRLKERCPGCGYLFDREEAFFLGAYMVNLVVSELVLGIVLIALIVRLASGHHAALAPWLAAGAATQVLMPAFFYPFSKTVWAAFDLAVRPLDPIEEAEAIAFSTAERERPSAQGLDTHRRAEQD
jgi:uncharacterized protein (DUF983 family)